MRMIAASIKESCEIDIKDLMSGIGWKSVNVILSFLISLNTDHKRRKWIRCGNLQQWVMEMFTVSIALFAKIEIRACNTLVTNSDNWSHVTAVTSNAMMNGFLLRRCSTSRCRKRRFLDWLLYFLFLLLQLFLFLLLQLRKYHWLSEFSNLGEACKDLLLNNLSKQLLLFFLL